MKKIYLLIGFLFLCSCNKEKSTFEIVPYNQLKKNVKMEFDLQYNKVPNKRAPAFAECSRIDKDCSCKVSSYKSLPLISNRMIVKACDVKFSIPMDYLHRVFVLDRDTIYIPYSKRGSMLVNGKPRSFSIDIDTINFIKYYGKEKIKYYSPALQRVNN
ncbi:hypothetical protein [Abyssalbus ytuae]|uniref:Lipoprotein n=1 Tax=Abyssalbus ytuae TaxID=2926907 RepID=A0A9E7CTN6_9FLAO|nr:hypothetical protein [Abyssalbus ytuae]UOB18371.1 hypothetical protein MQE35_03555 [Abyssalbus ytuae]